MLYRNRKNVDFKKITVEIPLTTYISMDCYCMGNKFPDKRDITYSRFIDLAINYYIDKH